MGTWVELGGGTFQEFTEGERLFHPNLDAREGPTVDIIWDAEREDIPLHDEHAEILRANHFLQHLPFERARYILRECLRVLKPGGGLGLMVGDIEWVCNQILKDGLLPGWAMCIWGEQEHPYDFHKWGYTFDTICRELEAAGFQRVTYAGHYNPWEMRIYCVK